MAFQKPKKPPQFADLKGILAQCKELDNPLYQVVEQIIDRLTQYKFVDEEEKIEIRRVLTEIPPLVTPTPPIVDPDPDDELHAMTHEVGGTDEIDGALNLESLTAVSVTGGTGFFSDLGATPLNAGNLTTGIVPGPRLSVDVLEHPSGYPGGTTNFLRADGTFSAISGASLTGIPETAIIDGALLARVAANENISGKWIFLQSPTIQHVDPELHFRDTDAAVDGKHWRIYSGGSSFVIQTMNDAVNAVSTVFEIQRSGNIVSNIIFSTSNVGRTVWDANGLLRHDYGLALNGRQQQAVSGDQTAWNPTGLGTAYVIQANPSVPVTIHGILAKPNGTTFVLVNATGSIITIPHVSGSAGGGNGIITPGGASISLGLHMAVTFMYDGPFGLWRVIGKAL